MMIVYCGPLQVFASGSAARAVLNNKNQYIIMIIIYCGPSQVFGSGPAARAVLNNKNNILILITIYYILYRCSAPARPPARCSITKTIY